MSDTMKPQTFSFLLEWILGELEQNGSVFGVPRSLFFSPQSDSPYATGDLFGHYLATPIGPAAGPHTQLAQNIVAAWLSGGRFIELKTVQIMDELEIPRPCIDLEDEGYNVEWSQELKLEQSAGEYVKAWALIHLLHRVLGFADVAPPGTILNMSVGYNLDGIQSPPMQRFMDRLHDASAEIEQIREVLRRRFPELADLQIPAQITNSVTLSTMHGCPPDEIERIARYLLEERGLHTIVKLNPTLLGGHTVRHILHGHLGYHEIDIPDAVFDHDLRYARAVRMIRVLKQSAAERGLFFGVKLSNTLAMANHKGILPGREMYMSGRALYPITINLFYRLMREFDGDLNVSYAGGADALNVTTLLSAGALPVTSASDLLKPGGYSRFLQYLETLEAEMRRRGVGSLEELARDKLANLERAAAESLGDPRYHKSYHPFGLPKVESELGRFDCIAAPCAEQCAVCQDVPEYAWLIAHGEYDRALEVILSRNPLPGVTGYVCTHLCQTRCTRNNYDEPVAIRALKRFAAERGKVQPPRTVPQRNVRVAVVGSGPSGLAAAYYLALSGVRVTIFEAREMPGGMLAIAPHFRLPPAVVAEDIGRITGLGVEIKLNHRITVPPEDLLKEGFDAVYLACGFQRDATLEIEGIDGRGVFTSLRFLEQVARGEKLDLGSEVLVIGGGNTAMDAARTAQRLTGRPATVVYRRTRAEMPAEEEEQAWLLEEGNRLLELISPRRVLLKDGRVVGLLCERNELGEADAGGRRRPVRVEGSEFELRADSIILAIGQNPDVRFLEGSSVSLGRTGAVAADPGTGRAASGVYAGGDMVRGPAIIIQACADGCRAAEAICRQLGVAFAPPSAAVAAPTAEQIIEVKRARARQEAQYRPGMRPVAQRGISNVVELALPEEEARREASRCLQCSTLCDKCVEVCPNRANYACAVEPASWRLPVLTCLDGKLEVQGWETFALTQPRQVLHVDDFCNECGNCATFCLHHGKPYAEKPRLFLRLQDLELERDNAFHVEAGRIWCRHRGETVSLSLDRGDLVFEDARLRITLSPDMQIRAKDLKESFTGVHSLRVAAEMVAVLSAATASLPFLLG